MFFVVLPFAFVDAAGSTHGFADAISFIINKLAYLLVAVGPQHFAVLAVALAVLPKPLVLAAVAPLHDAFAVHDVGGEGADLLGLGLAPALHAVPALDAVDELSFLHIAVDPRLDPLAVFLVLLEVAFLGVAIRLNQDSKPVFFAIQTFSLIYITVCIS